VRCKDGGSAVAVSLAGQHNPAMKHLARGVVVVIAITGYVRISSAGAATQPTAAEMILLADRSTQELRHGIDSADEAIRIASENLANAKTIAFKRRDAYPRGDGGADIGLNLDQGPLNSTGHPLDIGISGAGFFKVRVPDDVGNGFAFTRNGNFFIDSHAELVIGMGVGYRLNPPVALPTGVTEDCIQIADDGQIFISMPGSTAKTKVGQLQLTAFPSAAKLQHLGGSLYQETDQSGPPIEGNPGQNATGKTLAGFLEASNVSIEQEKLRLKKLRQWRKAMIQAVEEKR
jgi:flagellar basal body rod protein FlgG